MAAPVGAFIYFVIYPDQFAAFVSWFENLLRWAAPPAAAHVRPLSALRGYHPVPVVPSYCR